LRFKIYTIDIYLLVDSLSNIKAEQNIFYKSTSYFRTRVSFCCSSIR